MNAEDGRSLDSGFGVERAGQETVNHGAILAFRFDPLDARELDVFEKRVVGPGETTHGGAIENRDLGRQGRLALQESDATIPGVERLDIALARNDAFDGAAVHRDTRKVAVPAVFEGEEHSASIAREERAAHVSVKSLGERLNGARRDIHGRDVARAVPHVGHGAPGHVDDRRSVR